MGFTYLVAVVKENAESELGDVWKNKLSRCSEGILKVIELRCGSEGEESASSSVANTDIAQKLCKKVVSGASKPFIVVIPYGASARAKLSNSLSGYTTFAFTTDRSSVNDSNTLLHSILI